MWQCANCPVWNSNRLELSNCRITKLPNYLGVPLRSSRRAFRSNLFVPPPQKNPRKQKGFPLQSLTHPPHPVSGISQRLHHPKKPFSRQPVHFSCHPKHFTCQPEHFFRQQKHFYFQSEHFFRQPEHFYRQPKSFSQQPEYFSCQTERFSCRKQGFF